MEDNTNHEQTSDVKKKNISCNIIKPAVFIFIGLLLIVLIINVVMFATGFRAGFFHRWMEEQYFGKISEFRDGGFVIADENGKEKPVLIEKDTRIREGRQLVTEENLRVGSYVIVVGSQNDEKQIEAKVIRIFIDGR